MITIVDKTVPITLVAFSDLLPGEFFVYNDDLYQKVYCGLKSNCIFTMSGNPMFMLAATVTERCDVNISYERK